MTRDEHSPLPWQILNGGTHIVDSNAWTVADCNFGDACEDNARLIVAAVNSHADLLAAAKHTVATAKIYGYNTLDLRAAIARAEQV